MTEEHQQLLNRILDAEPGIKTGLEVFPQQSDILTLQRKGARELVTALPGLSTAQAQRFKGRLDVATAAMMRAFREQRANAPSGRSVDELKGPLALSSGPTFENQFVSSWGENTRPEAVDATTSPAAYLIDLLLFLQEYIEKSGDSKRVISLKTRRPDLYALVLDEHAMNRVVTQVEVVISIMERAIAEQPGAAPNAVNLAEDKLLEVRYPLAFPYETYWEQIKTVLEHNALSLSDVSRLSDMQYPYFIQQGAHSPWSDVALQQDSGLGPVLRALLLEEPYFGSASGFRHDPRTRRLLAVPAITTAERAVRAAADSTAFFTRNFGVPGFNTVQKVVSFCQALQIDQAQMESLFALAAYAPVQSANVKDPDSAPASAKAYGARYINSGEEHPVSVDSDADDRSLHRFRYLSEARCDKVNRITRLAKALQLSYAEADLIVCASLEAEQQAAAVETAADDKSLSMTINTLRAFGLFQYLRTHTDCKAEEFASLLAGMPVHAVGKTPSFFDRVFNQDTVQPLVLDGKPFEISGNDADSKRTVDQLCRGLGINMETFRYLARMILVGQGTGKLQRSLKTVSAFYRVTLLARLFSITTIELLSLLEVLGPNGQYAVALSGTPVNAMLQHFAQADTVSVIHAVGGFVSWSREHELPIGWVVQQLLPQETSQVVVEDVRGLFSELQASLAPLQDFDNELQQAGVRALKSKLWSQVLQQIVDADGLITDSGNSEQDFDPLQYEAFAAREIQVVIEALITPAEQAEPELPEMLPVEVEALNALVLGVVLRIRSRQWGVVQERVALFLSKSSGLAVPLIYWAGERVYTLLKAAVEFDPQQLQSDTMKAMMPFIHRLRRYAEVAERLALSPLMFSSFLMRSQRARFSVQSTDLTLHTLYYLERYSYCLRLSKQPEGQLPGYFTLMESMGELTDTEAPLIRDAAAEKIATWLGWGVREVLDVARHVTDDGIIRNLAQLCVLVRTRELSQKTGLSAASLMKVSRLSGHDDVLTYRQAAEEMLSSLRNDPQVHKDEPELRQSLASYCQVSELKLVAIKKDQLSTVTLRLLDLDNQPVPRIRVRWSTTLGTLLANYSYTDENGEASVRLASGDRVGSAHVTASYLLDSEAFAPPILIDCEEKSLAISWTGESPAAPWVLAGNQGAYTLKVGAADRYGNPGVDRLVIWATDIGTFVDNPGETLTDSNGISSIVLRSLHAGEGRVGFKYANDEDFRYKQIAFIDQPYIGSVLLASCAVVEERIEVTALVRSLDGEPFVGQKVSWAGSGVTIEQRDDQSGDKGVVNATLQASAAGPVSVTIAVLGSDGKAYQSRTLDFEVLSGPRLKDTPHSLRWPIADGIDAAEYEVHITSAQGKPVDKYPVVWSVSEGLKVVDESSVTGPDGVAHFALRSETPGARSVSATPLNLTRYDFPAITFIPQLQATFTFDGKPVDGPIVITQDPGDHTLTYALVQGHPLLAKGANLTYSGRDSDRSLGLTFEPGLGASNPFGSGTTVQWNISVRNTGLRQPSQIRLGIAHGDVFAPQWLDMVVEPAQQNSNTGSK